MEAAGEAMEVEVVVVVEEEEEDGEEVDGTKVDMETMEDMVDTEGREAGTSIKCDWSYLLCPGFILNTTFFL